MKQLLEQLYPLHRTLNHDDNDKALEYIGSYIQNEAFNIHDYIPGENIFDWSVPKRFYVKKAQLKDMNGQVIVDIRNNPLHIVSYSSSFEGKIHFNELKDHLYFDKESINDIPWIYKYYDDSWGLCLSYNDYLLLDENGIYEVDIETEFKDEPMRIGELYLPGKFKQEIVVVTDICHPYQVNDSISGVVIAAKIAKALKDVSLNNSVRFLFVPETIGTVAWFSTEKEQIKRTLFAMSFDCLGNTNSLKFQQTLYADTLLDQIGRNVAGKMECSIARFREYMSNDESMLSSPGLEIPTIAFTRAPFDEYHTSADTPENIHWESMNRSYEVIYKVLLTSLLDYYPKQKIQGFLFLKKHGLWERAFSNQKYYVKELFQLLNAKHTVFELCEILNLDFMNIYELLESCYADGLIDKEPITRNCSSYPKLRKINFT
jgi:aminopeptidase-like protein